MARPRKTTNVLRLTGADKVHPERMREREGEPENVNPIGDAPAYLSAAEAECWETLKKESIPGVLGEADRTGLMIASKLMAKFKDGETTGQELSQLTRLLSQFGMTPADRSKINLPGKKKKNAFDDD